MKSVFINGWTKETVINHIQKNFKGKSYCIEQNLCLYRGPKGKKCAIGMFIPDKEYVPNMDSSGSVDMLLGKYPNLEKYMPIQLYELCKLQTIHDRNGTDNATCLNDMLDYVESLI